MSIRAISSRSRQKISLTLVLFALGILLSAQFKTQQAILNSLENQKTEDLVAMWKSTQQKRAKLEQEVGDLQTRQASLTQKAEKGQTSLEEIEKELEKLQMASGLGAIKGSGITITINKEGSLLYLDMVDLINELWASGAEAVAVNGQRITLNSAIADLDDRNNIYITMNGQRIPYPLVIQALGDPQTLDKGLTFVGGLVDNLNTLYSVYPEIRQEPELTLPAAADPTPWKYARSKK